MELVNLSDRFDHVENCTEKHFIELLKGIERFLPDKTKQMKKKAMKNKRLHKKMKSQ